MRLSIHRGELRRFSVIVSATDKRYGVNVECLVFCTSREAAGQAAIEKMAEKWARNQGVHTEWKVSGKIREC